MNEVELNLVRLSLTGFGSTFDAIALALFIAVAAAYFLAPALGYESNRRKAILVALYVLVAFVGVSLGQIFVQWALMAEVVEEPEMFKRGGARPFLIEGPGRLPFLLLFSLATMKMFLFTAGLVAFVIGLSRLRLRPPELPVEPRDGGA